MNNEELLLKMILDESGFAAGMNNAVKKLGEFDGEVNRTGQAGSKSLGGIWTSFVGNFLASGATRVISSAFGIIQSSISGAISRVDTLNNSTRVFENMGFSVLETDNAMEALKESIQGLPTPLDSAVSGLQLIASSTNDLGKSQEVFAALNNGILGFGGTTDQVNNAIIQLSQAFSDGKVNAETWNSMINSGLGPALNALAKEMGLTAGQLKAGLSDGTISATQFQDALIDLNKNGGGGLKSLEQIAKDATAGIGTGFENMKTAVTRGVANVITAIDDSLKDAGMGGIGEIIAQIGAGFESGLTWIADNIPTIVQSIGKLKDTIEPFVPVLAGLAAGFVAFKTAITITSAIDTVIDGYNKWREAGKGLTVVQQLLNTTLLANPFALIVGAIVAVTTAVIYLWNTNEDFRNAVINIWDGIKETIGGAAEWVMDAWDSTKLFFSGLWDGFKQGASDAVQGIKDAWSGTKQWFSDTWTGIKDTAKGAWDSTVDGAKTGVQKVKDAWSGTKQWFSDTWTSIADSKTLGPLINGISTAFTNAKDLVSTILDEIVNIGQNAFELLKNVLLAPVLAVTSIITGGFGEMKEKLGQVWNNILTSAQEIWTSFSNIVVSIFTTSKDNVIAIASGWFESVKQIAISLKDIVIETITGMVESVKTWWTNLKDSTVNLTVETKDSVVQGWQDLKDSVVQKAVELKDSAIDAWNNLKQSVVDTTNNLVEGAQGAWENLKTGVSNTIDSVKGFFDDLRNIDLLQIGKDIIQGLIDGIGSKINDVKDSVVGMAGDIKDWITGALDIHSPSRWMKKMVGYNIPLGIVAGVDEKAGEVEKSVSDMIEAVKEPVQLKAVSTAATDLSSSSNSTTSEASANQTKSSGDTFNIYLQALGQLSESQLMAMAKQLVVYIQKVKNSDELATGGV